MIVERFTTPARTRRAPAGRRAFSLVELLVVITIVAVLIAVVLAAFSAARLNAQLRVEEAAARSMAFGVESFRTDAGFLPPLVHDGEAMTVNRPQNGPDTSDEWAGSPIDRTIMTPAGNTRWTPAVWDPRYSRNRWFLNGREHTGSRDRLVSVVADQRYSKLSIPYYISGVLSSAVDGVDGGAGADDSVMAEPLVSGAFRGVITDSGGGIAGTTGTTTAQRRLSSYFEPGDGGVDVTREYLDAVEYRENARGGSLPAVPDRPPGDEAPFLTTFTGGSGRAFRFYRWEPGGYDPSGTGLPDRSIRSVLDYNIPEVMLDPVALYEFKGDTEDANPSPSSLDQTVDPTADPFQDGSSGDAQLKGARWAIVAPGPDGLFGTEALEDLERGILSGRIEGLPGFLSNGLDLDNDEEIREARRWARRDNVVEVGR